MSLDQFRFFLRAVHSDEIELAVASRLDAELGLLGRAKTRDEVEIGLGSRAGDRRLQPATREGLSDLLLRSSGGVLSIHKIENLCLMWIVGRFQCDQMARLFVLYFLY